MHADRSLTLREALKRRDAGVSGWTEMSPTPNAPPRQTRAQGQTRIFWKAGIIHNGSRLLSVNPLRISRNNEFLVVKYGCPDASMVIRNFSVGRTHHVYCCIMHVRILLCRPGRQRPIWNTRQLDQDYTGEKKPWDGPLNFYPSSGIPMRRWRRGLSCCFLLNSKTVSIFLLSKEIVSAGLHSSQSSHHGQEGKHPSSFSTYRESRTKTVRKIVFIEGEVTSMHHACRFRKYWPSTYIFRLSIYFMKYSADDDKYCQHGCAISSYTSAWEQMFSKPDGKLQPQSCMWPRQHPDMKPELPACNTNPFCLPVYKRQRQAVLLLSVKTFLSSQNIVGGPGSRAIARRAKLVQAQCLKRRMAQRRRIRLPCCIFLVRQGTHAC